MINHATDYPLWIDMSRNVLDRCSCLASLSRWKTHGGRVVFASINTALRPGEQCIWMSWIRGRLHYVRIENLVGLVEVMSVRWMWVRSTVQSCSSFSKTWCGFQWNHTHFKVPFSNLANPFHTLSSYSHSTTVLNIYLPIQYLTSVHHDHEVSRSITMSVATLPFYDNSKSIPSPLGMYVYIE